MAIPIPTDPEEREAWRRDPDVYGVDQRLHEASEELRAAVDAQVNVIGLRLTGGNEPMRSALAEKGKVPPTQEQLVEAQQRVERAQAQWAAAVSDADLLLRERQEGGE
jgi:hypothetical protein